MRIFYRLTITAVSLVMLFVAAILVFGFTEAFGLPWFWAVGLFGVLVLPNFIYYTFQPGLAEVREKWFWMGLAVVVVIVGSTWIGERIFG